MLICILQRRIVTLYATLGMCSFMSYTSELLLLMIHTRCVDFCVDHTQCELLLCIIHEGCVDLYHTQASGYFV